MVCGTPPHRQGCGGPSSYGLPSESAAYRHYHEFMKAFLPKAGWLKGYITPVFLLLALLGLYYFAYVPSRKATLTSRNFRLLADMSDQIKSDIASLANPLINYSESTNNLFDKRVLADINEQLHNLVLTGVFTNTNSALAGQMLCELRAETDPPT